jgi:hypothetical protein
MPQLPSGRHAGIDPARLFQLFKDAESGRFVHRLMAISAERHLLPHIEILELVPAVGQGDAKFNAASSPRPCEFMSCPTGVTVDKLGALSGDWPSEDVEGFRKFLETEQAAGYLGKLLEEARRRQKSIAAGGPFVARIQALWWQAGIHPAQEEGWEDGDSSMWDDYDIFVALSVLLMGLDKSADDLSPEARQAVDLTMATLALVIQELPDVNQWSAECSGDLVREIASGLREKGLLEELPADKRQWFHRQFREAAIALCSAIDGSVLRAIDREGAMIASLAFVSSD